MEDNVVYLRNTCKGNYVKPNIDTRTNILSLSAMAITTLVLVDMPKKYFYISHANTVRILKWFRLGIHQLFWEKTNAILIYEKECCRQRNNMGVCTNTLYTTSSRVVEYCEKVVYKYIVCSCTVESINFSCIKLNRNVIKYLIMLHS